MSDYGVTKDGFVLKRLDTILEEIHSDLTSGYGFDTRLTRPSFLDTLTTTFASQIADLWEVAQDSYYAKYPTTAEGINLDNAVQFGGIRRSAARKTVYPIHCMGDDGTVVNRGVIIATDTKPEVRLASSSQFTITRSACNMITIITAVVENGVYTVSLNGESFSHSANNEEASEILTALASLITAGSNEYTAVFDGSVLSIADKTKTRNNDITLSDNLTTKSVTTIANFATEEYGSVTLPYGIITKIITNTAGFKGVDNKTTPTYGRNIETDIELRKSYVEKSALRSATMIDSITSELMNNVPDVTSASGYENDTDVIDDNGLPPHSIEIVVEGGDESNIAEAILYKKAGGIQTFGSILMEVPTKYGQTVPIRFNRPTYLYTWIKAVIKGTNLPKDYITLVRDSIVDDTKNLGAGDNLLIQLLHEGIYDTVSGVEYVDIKVAYSADSHFVPSASDYVSTNITTTMRQMVVTAPERIEVSTNDS